jgi:hypothetical protein
MSTEVVIEVAGEAAIKTEEVVFTALGVMLEGAMGRTADGEMRAAEVNEEVIKTTGVAQITEQASMPAVDQIRRMRRQTLPLRMASTITLPSLAAHKHQAQHNNNMTPMLSPRSCHICLHRPACNPWPHMPTT